MNNYPKVTVLLATYNRAHLIEETLESIIAQTYTNWECVIIDDNSTDPTPSVIQKYLDRDNRFAYYLKTNIYKNGLSGSRNMGLDIASERNAEFIQFFDDDDIMHPEKLQLQVLSLLENPDKRLSICKFEKMYIDENGAQKNELPIFNFNHRHLGDSILDGSLIVNNLSVIFKMDIINKFRFDEDLHYAEEWELFTRLGYVYPNDFCFVNEYLFKYRKHTNSITSSLDLDYNIRKSSAIIRIKLNEFLLSKELHTEKSIVFFYNTFLFDQYNPKTLRRIIQYVKDHNLKKRIYYFFKTVLALHIMYRKIVIKFETLIK